MARAEAEEEPARERLVQRGRGGHCGLRVAGVDRGDPEGHDQSLRALEGRPRRSASSGLHGVGLLVNWTGNEAGPYQPAADPGVTMPAS